MKEQTALNFFKEIKKEQNKYKLVNGLFIVKYLDTEISIFIGNFEPSGSVFNQTKTNKVLIYSTNQKFNKIKNLTTNARGDSWRKLNISFKEKPIKEILNNGN